MKKLKKMLCVLVAAVSVVCALAFTGCDGKEGTALSGTMKIVITPDTQSEATVIEVDLSNFNDKNSVMDVVDYLAESQKICYKASSGVYGKYLTAIGVPVEQTYEGQTSMVDHFILEESVAEKRSIYTYTSVDADKLETTPDSGYTAMTVEYEGMTLTESMNSVSKMTICDGAVIYFTYLIWG